MEVIIVDIVYLPLKFMTLLLKAEFVNLKAFYNNKHEAKVFCIYLLGCGFTIERQFVPLFEIIINLSWTRQTHVLALCIYVFGWTVACRSFFNKLNLAWASFVTFFLTNNYQIYDTFYCTIITFSGCKKHSFRAAEMDVNMTDVKV